MPILSGFFKRKSNDINNDQSIACLNNALRFLLNTKVRANVINDSIREIYLAIAAVNGDFYEDVWKELEKRNFYIRPNQKKEKKK